MTPIARRLAAGVLAALAFVIVAAIVVQPTTATEEWLWSVRFEWNFISGVASTQLALVAAVILLTSWLARERPTWQRLCTAGMGLAFLFIALEEFLDTKHPVPDWPLHYAMLGATLAAIAAIIALRSPWGMRLWFILLIVGLSVVGAGAILLDALSGICNQVLFFYVDGCLNRSIVEESLELLGSWLTLVAMLGWFSYTVPKPGPRLLKILYALPVVWILICIAISPVPGFKFSLPAEPVSVRFESGLHVYGYSSDDQRLPASAFLWLSKQAVESGLGYSLHLVDQVTGDSIASRNDFADRVHLGFLSGKSYTPVFEQPLALQIPPHAPTNRALWVVMTVWREHGDEFVYQKILESDRRLLSDTQVVLDELVLRAQAAPSPAAPMATFDGGIALEGFDVPERARAGETMHVDFRWRTDADGSEDYAQFLHFIHEESGALWSFDQQPLGPRLPTRLWYSGMADTEAWAAPLPADLESGTYAVFTGLYRQSDLERLPVENADGTPFIDASVPLGSLQIDA
ncbi:MAG: hypothetical protein OXG49_04940 [Chloroflexi bacterium]|nr:hypothetical protein [Chloroflexota bacterium]